MAEPMEILQRAFNNLINVRVITAVGNVSLSVTSDAIKVGQNAQEISDAILTNFDLVDGDITNVIPPSLKGDAELMAFHSTQVEKALTVLPGNIRMLIELGQTIAKGLND